MGVVGKFVASRFLRPSSSQAVNPGVSSLLSAPVEISHCDELSRELLAVEIETHNYEAA